MHPLEQIDQTFIQMTLRYEPWSDWKPSFFFSLCNKINYIGKVTVLVTYIYIYFPPNYATQTFSPSYQGSSDFDTFWNFCYFLKENAYKLIWWRPSITLIFQMNELPRKFSCMPTQNKVSSSYFIVHLSFKLNPPGFWGLKMVTLEMLGPWVIITKLFWDLIEYQVTHLLHSNDQIPKQDISYSFKSKTLDSIKHNLRSKLNLHEFQYGWWGLCFLYNTTQHWEHLDMFKPSCVNMQPM